MVRPRQYVECAWCGGARTLVRENGRANDGVIPVRERLCVDCGRTTMTAEVPIFGTTLTRLDEGRRAYARIQQRRKNGYQGIHHSGTILRSDTLKITCRVVPGTYLRGPKTDPQESPLPPVPTPQSDYDDEGVP